MSKEQAHVGLGGTSARVVSGGVSSSCTLLALLCYVCTADGGSRATASLASAMSSFFGTLGCCERACCIKGCNVCGVHVACLVMHCLLEE